MKIAIYHTTDIHGYIFPTNYISYEELGMLKILSYISKDREKYDKSLLLDAGDLIQGSAMTNYLSKKRPNDNPITDLVRTANYDAVVLGNHEFNYGLDYLYSVYKPIEDLLINSNIEGLDIESKPYKIFDLDGYKIGVFGATTAYILNWEKATNIKGLSFNNPVDIYREYEKELVENSDYIIVLYHGGFEKSLDGKFIPTEKLNGENQASEMLEKFDSINAILSGHQHRSLITKLNGVVCSQPINNARNFTKLVIDTDKSKVDYKLIDVKTKNMEIIEEYSDIFIETNKELKLYLDKIIGHLDKSILLKDHFDARLYGHPYINLIHDIQLHYSDADFSSVTLFDTAIGFDKEITIRDIIINYPYPNTLVKLEITGHDLKRAIEISSTYFIVDDNNEVKINPKYIYPKRRNYKYDFYYGLEYIIDLNKPFGQRVTSMTRNGEELNLDNKYSIVLNNYRASNTNDYPCYENKKILQEINIDMSELMINYIEEKKEIKANMLKNYSIKK